jgi:hypothetical protein
MRKPMPGHWLFIGGVLLAGCATTTGLERTGESRGLAQNPAEAQAQIDAIVAERPELQTDRSTPTDLAAVVEILRRDEFFRFDATSEFLANLPGVDALILRALVECASADVYNSVAALVERKEVRDREALALLQKQASSGAPNDGAEKKRAEQLQERADARTRAVRALRLLYRYHANIATDLAQRAIRESPEQAGGYLALAGVARLLGDWSRFDDSMQRAEQFKADPMAIAYLRAMERLDRLADPTGAEQLLREILARDPSLVRAQVKLLLTKRNIEDVYAEFKALEKLCPSHLLVAIAGRDLEDEYRVSMQIRAAVAAPTTPSAASPATPTSEVPTSP